MDNKVILISKELVYGKWLVSELESMKLSKQLVVLDYNHWVDKICTQLKGACIHVDIHIKEMFQSRYWVEIFKCLIAKQISMRHNQVILVTECPEVMIDSLNDWGCQINSPQPRVEIATHIEKYEIPSSKDLIVIDRCRPRRWWNKLSELVGWSNYEVPLYKTLHMGDGTEIDMIKRNIFNYLGDLNGMSLIVKPGRAKFGLGILQDIEEGKV